MATHSSILAWEIPRTEKPGGLESMVSQRVGHDLEPKQQLCILYKILYLKYILCSKKQIIPLPVECLYPFR